MQLKSLYLTSVFTLLILAQNSYSQIEFLVTLDRTTGEHTIINNLPTVNFIYVDATAYDKDGKRYILNGIDFDGNDRLFCVDSNTGATISEPLLAGNIGQLHYDHSSDILYGLEIADGEMHVVSIDIPTASTTNIVNLPVVGYTSSSTFFDEVNQNFVVMKSGLFYAANVETGELEITPATDSFTAFQYDNTNENLYGLILGVSTQLVRIDIEAGTHTIIATMPESGYLSTIPCFDEINQYYTYSSPSFLYTVDVLTGTILLDPIFPNVEIGENIIECHYDNETGILYALHWGGVPDPAYVLNDTICKGEIATLTLVGPGDYGWTTTEDPMTILETENTFNVSPIITTDYYALNAEDTILARVVVIETFADFNVTDTIGCSPLVVKYTDLSSTSIGSIAEWIWTFSDGNSSNIQNPIQTYNTSEYSTTTLQIITNYGCISTISFETNITVIHTPHASFTHTSEDPENENKVSFLDGSLNAQTWEWSFGDGNYSSFQNPSHLYDENGTYNVILKISNGYCNDSIIKQVTLKEDLLFYIPNAFTPNSGEFNNVFSPIFATGYNPYNYHLTIFNRWGEIVFESYDTNFGWDGNYGYESVSTGVFIWQVKFQLEDSPKMEMYRGHVTLIR